MLRKQRVSVMRDSGEHMCKVGPSPLILSSLPSPPPVPGEFQGTSVLAIQLLPWGKDAIKWAAGLPLKMVVHSQDSEHLVAIIDTCDRPVPTRCWKQTASPRP